MVKTPKVFVFDLDGCLWDPEMYELHGGSPFNQTPDGNLKDKSGNTVALIGDVREIMYELKTDSEWMNTKVAIASKCDEPNWAHECLDKFLLPEKIKLRTVFDPNLIEIYYGNKQNHLRTIAEKTGYKLQEMVFFDNQMDNCRDVAQLGVTVAYTPSGVTREAFNKVLEVFPAQNGQMVKVK